MFKFLRFLNKDRDNSKTVRRKVLENIAVIYYIPKHSNNKYAKWTDGFVKGIEYLNEDYNIDWINLADEYPSSEKLNGYDFLIVKSCWDWVVDNYITSLKNLNVPKGIMISCSKLPKIKKNIFNYDVLWYETFWYGQQIMGHPLKIHAFGIDSTLFKKVDIKKNVDLLSIGGFTSYKRFDFLINKDYKKKLVVGTKSYDDSNNVIIQLENNNIECVDYVNQEDLVNIINQSKLVYLPCEINGGGERALLEARACGVKVLIEDDNPKLKELLDGPIWDEKYYGNQIKYGIERFYEIDKNIKVSNIIEPNRMLKVGRSSFHNGNFEIKGDEYIEIGSYCSFGKSLKIYTSNHDINYSSSQGFLYRKNFGTNHPGETKVNPSISRSKGPVKIGNDVWIGDDVKIMSGVTIGDGACVAANSLVTKDIGCYEIHGGIPAKLLKMRFKNPEIVKMLISLKWWEWSDKKIRNNEFFFNLNLNNIDDISKIEVK